MMDGWICLHRQLLDSAVFADADLLRLWIWLLAKAGHMETHVSMRVGRGSTTVTLDPGQCIVGRHTGSESLDWPPSSFRNRIEKLEQMGMILQQKDSHWTVVSIVNWGRFQTEDDEERTGKGQAKDKLRTGKGQAKDTNNNANNANNAKKVRGASPRFVPPSVDDVRAYCRDRSSSVDPERFVDFYTSKGWMVGKTKMKDWQSSVRTWEKSNTEKTPPKAAADKRGPTLDELAAMPTTPRKAVQ